MRTVLSVLAVLLAFGSTPASAQPKLPKQPKPKLEKPTPLPKELLAAWEQAGLSPGWVRLGRYPLDFRMGGEGFAGDRPAFAVAKWDAAAFAMLPAPDQPFGLFLDDAPVKDADLKRVAGFGKLRLFQCRSQQVTAAGLKHLAGLVDLEAVELFTKVKGDDAATALGGLKKLVSLQLYTSSPLTEAGMKELAGLSELRELAVEFGGTAAELRHLSEVRKLWRLEIGAVPVTDNGLKEIAALRHLDYLNLNSAVLTDVGLKHLAGFELLRELHLGNHPRITDAGVKELAALKDLQELDLAFTAVNGTGLAALADLKQLHTLNLRGAKITDEGLKSIAKLKQVHSLYMSDTRVTDAGLKELAALPKLIHLHVGNRAITDAGVKELTACKKLNGLNLLGASVTDACLPTLRTFPNLGYVDLRSTKVTAEGVAASKKTKPKLNLER